MSKRRYVTLLLLSLVLSCHKRDQRALNEALIQACETGSLGRVDSLVKDGAAVDDTVYERSPLAIAFDRGDAPIISRLISSGADVNTKVKGQTLIRSNFSSENIDYIQEFRTAFPPVHPAKLLTANGYHGSEDGFFDWWIAIFNCDSLKLSSYLSKTHADDLELDSLPALHWAVISGNLISIRLVMNAGADANKIDRNRWTPLVWSAYLGDTAITGYLVARGGNVNHKTGRFNSRKESIVFDPQGVMGDISALFVAASRNNLSMVNFLLDRGADPDIRTNWGWTPLFAACEHGNFEMARSLISKGANPELQSTGEELVGGGYGMGKGSTPFHRAARSGRIEIIKLLFDHGAEINGKAFPTPLQWAALSGNKSILKFLVDHGADIKKNPKQLLYMACFGGVRKSKMEAVQYLLESGLHMDKLDFSPLDAAIDFQDSLLVDFLLQKGANPNLKNSDGQTALEKAISRGHRREASVIRKYRGK